MYARYRWLTSHSVLKMTRSTVANAIIKRSLRDATSVLKYSSQVSRYSSIGVCLIKLKMNTILGMKKMEYKGQQFHENCFLCFTCNTPIGTKSFIPKDNKIYCVPCYENLFATKCTKCTKVISNS
jgi:hypothetical protein